MVHQFGHMLGLGHSARQTSAMTPFYLDWVSVAEVGPDPGDREMVRTRGQSAHSGTEAESKTQALIILLVCVGTII